MSCDFYSKSFIENNQFLTIKHSEKNNNDSYANRQRSKTAKHSINLNKTADFSSFVSLNQTSMPFKVISREKWNKLFSQIKPSPPVGKYNPKFSVLQRKAIQVLISKTNSNINQSNNKPNSDNFCKSLIKVYKNPDFLNKTDINVCTLQSHVPEVKFSKQTKRNILHLLGVTELNSSQFKNNGFNTKTYSEWKKQYFFRINYIKKEII